MVSTNHALNNSGLDALGHYVHSVFSKRKFFFIDAHHSIEGTIMKLFSLTCMCSHSQRHPLSEAGVILFKPGSSWRTLLFNPALVDLFFKVTLTLSHPMGSPLTSKIVWR